MKNAIILHGRPGKSEYYSDEFPSASNSHWLPWLQKQLLINDIKADTPEVPHAYHPAWDVWQTEFERFDITPETILVGHSCGAGFLVRWLSEHPEVRVAKVILVAPYLAPEDREDKTIDKNFFEFQMDKDLVKRCNQVVIFNSTDDASDIHISVDMIRSGIEGIAYREFENYGHFCKKNLGTEAFPELLEECLK